LRASAEQILDDDVDGVLVKAHPSATNFFRARGFEPVGVEDPKRDYAHRLWKPRTRAAIGYSRP
jgi:hypothetical protein